MTTWTAGRTAVRRRSTSTARRSAKTAWNRCYIRGSGGEDTFGTSFGGALHRPETHLYQGIPYYVHEDVVAGARPAQRLGAYRFFEHDAIPFERSIHFRFGCMANDICSTAYWYQTQPHRPFVRMPEWPELKPATELRRGSIDLLDADGASGSETVQASEADGEWWLCGPFENEEGQAMARRLPPEDGASPGTPTRGTTAGSARVAVAYAASGRKDQHQARWVKRRSVYGFVDFSHAFRPWTRGIAYSGRRRRARRLSCGRTKTARRRCTWRGMIGWC